MSKKKQKPSTRGASKDEAQAAEGGEERKPARRPRRPKPPAVGIAGVPGSKNPERRCTATSAASGERCKRAAIKGGFVCTSHGGASPQVRKKAKERLLELVDPALASLQKVLTDPNTEDSVKVRAALGILDRTGHGPGAKVEVGISKWDEFMQSAAVKLDRDSLESDESVALPSWEDVETHATEAQAQAWASYDAEDAPRRIDPDASTVRGEVVSILPEPPDTRGAATEYDRGHTTAWPYGREPG